MITVACVLRSGGDYDRSYVDKLASGIGENLHIPHRLVCLTDRRAEISGMECKGLLYEWPGWWSKIEVFGLEPPVLYFDLDTVITGDITPLAQSVADSCDGLMMLRGFYRSDKCSGIMGWRQDMKWLLGRFLEHYAPRAKFGNHYDMRVNGNRYRGDQDWLAAVTQKERTPVTFAQDVFPGIYSYKVDVAGRGIPDDARVICFHGKPRPHEVQLEGRMSCSGG